MECTNAQGQHYTADKCDGDAPPGASGIGYYLAQVVYAFTVGLGSIVAALGALLLNIAISFSLDSSAYNLDFIALGWTMLRDIANMTFIFILIYIAIQVMFQAQTHGTVERLVKVLAVALIINFSFFATRVVIDAGNLVSVQFYNAIVTQPGGSVPSSTTISLVNGFSSGIPVPDITQKIMAGVNFQSAINADSFKNVSGLGDVGDLAASFISFSFVYIVLGAMLFMLAAAFVAAAIKFLIRIVMLWFSIITAPLALVAWSFQGGGGHGGHGGGYFGRWLSNLINHAIYPAVFLFVLLIISNFMQGSNAILPGTSISGQEGIGNLVVVIAQIGTRLGFVLVMLYFALRASNYIEVAYSNVANQIGNTLTFGGLEGYRRGLGWAGNRAARIVSAPISQPLGSAAGLGNTLLKNSGALNRNGLGGGAARAISSRVLQPLTKTSFAGEKSYADLMADQEHREHESHDRDLLEKVRTSDNPVKDLSDKEKDRINKMNPSMFVGLSAKDAEKVSSLFTEETTKKIRESDKVGEEVKHAIDHAWSENSEHAPLQKANKLVDEVAKTNEKLGDLIYTVDNQTFKLSELSKAGTKINKARLDAVKETISKKLDDAQTSYQTAQIGYQEAIRQNADGAAKIAKDAMVAAKTTERNASDTLKKIDKLADETAKVPANPDHGRNKKGEFNKFDN